MNPKYTELGQEIRFHEIERCLQMKTIAMTLVTGILAASIGFAQERGEKRERPEAQKSERKAESPAPGGTRLVSKGQKGWRYLDAGKAPSKEWTGADFDDSKWKVGQAPLGYGEDDVVTELSYGDDEEQKFPAAYFRLKFQVDDPAAAQLYAGRIRVDDSAVVYLNGKEIKRLRLGKDGIEAGGYSRVTAGRDSAAEDEFMVFAVRQRSLVKGENLFCVSVHQGHAASSDLFLDLEFFDISREDYRRLASSAQRTRSAEARRYRQQRKVEVKDPAGFSKSQEKPLFSGPQSGEKLPSFKAFGIRGKTEGKELDAIAAAAGKAQVLIFQDDNRVGIRGIYGISRALSKIVEKSKKGLSIQVVFLGDDATELSSMLKRIATRLPEVITLGTSREGREGPGSYGLNRNVSMTVLVAREGKVLHNFAFQQPLLYVDPHVLGGIAEAIGEKRETVQGWLNEGATGGRRTRGEAAPRRRERTREGSEAGDEKARERRGEAKRKKV